jgi:hypothetical protein
MGFGQSKNMNIIYVDQVKESILLGRLYAALSWSSEN